MSILLFFRRIGRKRPSLEKPQPERIGDHTDGTQAHGRRANHGAKPDIEHRIKQACRHGNATDIVEKCPE